MALYTRLTERTYHEPVLVMCLEGWIDAGLGAAGALASITEGRTTERVALWDADELIDHRARRPVLHLADGLATGLTWPEIELRAGVDDAGRDFLVLLGPEPDMRWHAFAASVVEIARLSAVRLAVGIGAFPAPVPHTRPVRLVSTAPSRELAGDIEFIAGSLDVPAGVQAALEEALNAGGVPAIGLWARVPHYVVSMPYPAAGAALVDGLCATSGLVLPSSELHGSAVRASARIDELIANSDDHRRMVAQLESQADQESQDRIDTIDLTNLPSGDEIAAELERYLRGDTTA